MDGTVHFTQGWNALLQKQIMHRQDKLNVKVGSCVMVTIKFERPSWWQINVRSLSYERNIKKFS